MSRHWQPTPQEVKIRFRAAGKKKSPPFLPPFLVSSFPAYIRCVSKRSCQRFGDQPRCGEGSADVHN